jgi:two-component system, OmpR family, sensor kinase
MIGIPTAAPGSRLRQWWSRRPLRARITIAVGLVSLIVLLALSRLGVVFLYGAVLDAADAELRVQAVTVSVRIAGGTPASEVRNAQIRVVDNAGAPVDDGPPLPLTPAELRRLAAGESVLSGRLQELRIWVAVPAVALDGSTRRVVVTADLVGAVTLLGRAAIASVVGAVPA